MKTTIALILIFTSLVLYFGVEKPAAVEASSVVETAPKKAQQKAGPSEFSQPTTIAPKEAAASSDATASASTDDALPVTALTSEALNEEIETLQQYVTRENAIARLNEDGVSPEERAAWGKIFERLLALRSQQLRLGLEKAQAALETYKTQHEERVASYVGSKS